MPFSPLTDFFYLYKQSFSEKLDPTPDLSLSQTAPTRVCDTIWR